MEKELNKGTFLGISKTQSTKPKSNFGIKMDIEVEQIGAEEEDKDEEFTVGGGLNIQKKKSQLSGLRPSKFQSSSGLSQGSAIDDGCSMDEQEDYFMGDNVFDNFATGLDLNADNKSHSSGGVYENADVFEVSIMLKTKKKSCKTYWLQLLGIDAFFYKK